MVLLETVSVFTGWDYGVLDSTLIDCVGVWHAVLRDCFCVYVIYFYEGFDLWRSGRRVAVHDVHYFPDRRRAAALHRDHGAVYEQDVHGSEEPAKISDQRGVLVVV